jgi:hypothetical protein
MILKCKEVVKLASQGIDQQLPWTTRLKIRLHLLFCIWCKRYRKQLQFIHGVCEHLPEEMPISDRHKMPEPTRKRIEETLRNSHQQ